MTNTSTTTPDSGSPVHRLVGQFLYIPIESSSDIETARNRMAKGNYPLTMSDCSVVGINGDCGAKCPVFMSGKCPSPDGIIVDDILLPNSPVRERDSFAGTDGENSDA